MEQRFGQALRDLRRLKGVTQQELATKSGVSLSYISKVEKGRVPPPAVDTIVKICNILEVPPDKLLVLAGRLSSSLINTIGSSAAALEFVRHAESMDFSAGEWQKLTQELKCLHKRTILDLQPGDHICCVYETEEEHRALLSPFPSPRARGRREGALHH